jgi:hypothetical protein
MVVLIACPIDDRLVPTSIEVTEISDLEGSYELTDCPSCGSHHQWQPHDAVLAPARKLA